MSLIGFHTEADRADLYVDSLCYGRAGHTVETDALKGAILPGLPGAMAFNGLEAFAPLWGRRAADLAVQSDDFDAFTAAAGPALVETWRQVVDLALDTGFDPSALRATVFTVGWSPSAGTMVAYGYCSSDGFARVDLTGTPYVQPAPMGTSPGPFEQQTLRAAWNALAPPDVADALFAKVTSWPALQDPGDVAGWVALANRIRETRSFADINTGMRTLIGGHVLHIALTPTSADWEFVHEFDDTGPNLARMMSGTLHPSAQEGPCPCGSERSMIDCCLAGRVDGPCPCRSGRTLLDCCAVRAPAACPR